MMNATAIVGILVQISLFLVVMGFGLQASREEMIYMLRHPRKLLKSIISINVIMPVFACLLVTLFTFHPIVEVALVAVAVSPVPPILPGKESKAGGNRPFTYGLLAAVSLLSVIVIPLTFKILQAVFNREANFSELFIAKTIGVGLILPFAFGMLVQRLAPGFAARYAGMIGKVGMILLIVAFLPVLLSLLPVMWELIGNGTILAIVAFTVVGLIVGHLLGGPAPRDRTVLAIATVSRHPAIAIALASANVGEGESKTAVAAVLLYLLVSSVAVAPYIRWVTSRPDYAEEAVI
jgi:BASS family bile acid:Na+ symporter